MFYPAYRYPTEKQLKRIQDWDFEKGGVKEFISYIRKLWWSPDWGFWEKPDNKLELHTGGWSGNEDIVGAMKKTWFWSLLTKEREGGHYWFRIKKVGSYHG